MTSDHQSSLSLIECLCQISVGAFTRMTDRRTTQNLLSFTPFISHSCHPTFHLPPLLSVVTSRGGHVLSCHPNSSRSAATGGFCCPAVLNLLQPNTTAAGPARPMSNSFSTECTKVGRIIFSYSAEAPGVESLAAESYTSTFPSLSCWEHSDGPPWKSLNITQTEMVHIKKTWCVFKMKTWGRRSSCYRPLP